MAEENRIKEAKKVKLYTSPNMPRSVATDVALSGPTPDSFHHVSFLTDRVNLIQQSVSAPPDSDNIEEVELSFEVGDTELVREVTGQALLNDTALLGLFGLMASRVKKIAPPEFISQVVAELTADADKGN